MYYGTENASQFGVKRIKVQGHGEIKYPRNSTSGLVNTSWKVSVGFSPNLHQ